MPGKNPIPGATKKLNRSNHMKKAIIIAAATLTLCSGGLKAQSETSWPSGSSAIALNVGTIILASPFVASYDHLWHLKKIHLGTTTGITFCAYAPDHSWVFGGYAAVVLLSGMGNHHFESRLGATYYPIQLSPDPGKSYADIHFMPVILLGYRFQKPGGNRFYRLSVGTGGIGVGIGFVFGQNQTRAS